MNTTNTFMSVSQIDLHLEIDNDDGFRTTRLDPVKINPANKVLIDQSKCWWLNISFGTTKNLSNDIKRIVISYTNLLINSLRIIQMYPNFLKFQIFKTSALLYTLCRHTCCQYVADEKRSLTDLFQNETMPHCNKIHKLCISTQHNNKQ